MLRCHQMPNHETGDTGNEIWPVYVILQNKFLIKKFYEKCEKYEKL